MLLWSQKKKCLPPCFLGDAFELGSEKQFIFSRHPHRCATSNDGD